MSDTELACDVCGDTRTAKGILFSPQSLGMHRYHQHQIRSTEQRKHVKKKPQPPLAQISPEDVVVVVLEQMFPQGIPVAKIGAVLRWQDATVQFMKEMS